MQGVPKVDRDALTADKERAEQKATSNKFGGMLQSIANVSKSYLQRTCNFEIIRSSGFCRTSVHALCH